jgi:hypothetical protein
MAARWLADFEAKVAAGERRGRTLDLYRSPLQRHLLPRLGRRRLALITADDVVALMRECRRTASQQSARDRAAAATPLKLAEPIRGR